MDNSMDTIVSSQEPHFGRQGCTLEENVMQDVYATLVEKNQENIKCRRKLTSFSHDKIAECVFLLCDYFQQRQETRYIALQLIHGFLSAKCDTFLDNLSQSSQPNSDKLLQWRNFVDDFMKRAFLYVIAACQIASKICCHQQTISSNKSLQLMQGTTHDTSNINQIALCEAEVLQSVNYKLPFTTILTFTEALLEMLGSSQSCDVSVKALHNVCLKIIDLVCMQKGIIFDRLFESMVGSTAGGSKQRSNFVFVENDDLLLSTGVVETAVYISNKEKHVQVLNVLCQLTNISREDILDLSSVLLETILPAFADTSQNYGGIN